MVRVSFVLDCVDICLSFTKYTVGCTFGGIRGYYVSLPSPFTQVRLSQLNLPFFRVPVTSSEDRYIIDCRFVLLRSFSVLL